MLRHCLILVCVLLVTVACGKGSSTSGKLKVLRLAMRTDGPKSLDPVRGSTVYDNIACCQIYETLLQYKYLVRPPTLEPLLLEEMPQVSEDGRTYRFKLKKGTYFHDDPCFPDGKGRELVAEDVFYSWKRIANNKTWWLLEKTIVGFDEYRDKQREADDFDYHAPVDGMRIINSHEFEVDLREPITRFLYVIAMHQTSIVPHEAVEKYGTRFNRHPVGTGPFLLEKEEDWSSQKSLILHRNPNYREAYYPTEFEESDKEFGFDKPAGQRIPFVDRIEYYMFVEDNPMWLEFLSGKIDYTQVPAENFEQAFIKRTRKLKPEMKKKGITAHTLQLLDFIFRGFNMEDELLGGYTPEKKALRRAIHLAIDLDEFNESFYNGINIVYDGPIPPGLEGYPEGGRVADSNQGPDLERARKLLAEAGYPGGKGLPVIDYWVNKGGNSKEQSELMQRQLGKIGVKLNVKLVDFSQLIAAVDNKKAPFFSFAWGTDYPDAENNLALFYGPNESPGSNHYNYKNAEYDRLYEKIRAMPPSPERTKIYIKMRDMVIEDVPYMGSMARKRFYLVQPRLKNFKPIETWFNWPKYLDVDDKTSR